VRHAMIVKSNCCQKKIIFLVRVITCTRKNSNWTAHKKRRKKNSIWVDIRK